MRKQVVRICMLLACAFGFMQGQACIQPSIVKATIDELIAKDAKNQAGITKGVEQVARLWQTSDGDEQAFQTFCRENYLSDPAEKDQVFLKISEYLEGINGNFNEMVLCLQRNLNLDAGPLHAIDEKFGSYSPSSHLMDDYTPTRSASSSPSTFPNLLSRRKRR